MKTLFTFIFFLASINLFSQNEFVLTSNFPEKLQAGKTYEVTETIQKPDIRSYAYYQRNFPSGITVNEVSSDEADFMFEDNVLSFTWYRLPKSNSITIKYNITIAENTKGKYESKGDIVYIYYNNRGEFQMPVLKFSIEN